MKAAAKKDEEASKAKVVIPAGQKAASTFGLWAGMDKLVAMAEGAPQTVVDISKPLLLQCNAVKHAELEDCQPIRSACFQEELRKLASLTRRCTRFCGTGTSC